MMTAKNCGHLSWNSSHENRTVKSVEMPPHQVHSQCTAILRIVEWIEMVFAKLWMGHRMHVLYHEREGKSEWRLREKKKMRWIGKRKDVNLTMFSDKVW